MAHWEQNEFVRRVRGVFPEYFKDARVLEIGSGEIRGGVRGLFQNCEYTGVDLAEGPGVDRVCPGQDVDEPSTSFDVAVSCECFEHNPYWLETFVNMLRILRPGGLFVMSCALTGRQEHGTQRMDPEASLAESVTYKDYYRNLSMRDFTNRIDLSMHFETFAFHENIFHKDLYFVGLKRGRATAENQHRMVELHRSIRQIRRQRPLSSAAWVAAYLKQYFKRGVVFVVGEDTFHDLKFRGRRLVRRLGETVLGEARVRKIGESRRPRR